MKGHTAPIIIHWPSQEQFISYRGSQNNSFSPVDFSGHNAMVHNPFQETKMLSEGEPALKEMACPENIHCGEQFVAF